MNDLERKAEIAEILIKHLCINILNPEKNIKCYVLGVPFGFGIFNSGDSEKDYARLEQLLNGNF